MKMHIVPLSVLCAIPALGEGLTQPPGPEWWRTLSDWLWATGKKSSDGHTLDF
jgi:hypothetical protein